MRIIKSNIMEMILAGLNERLKEPSLSLPNIRWIAETELINLLLEIRDTLEIRGIKSYSGKLLLEYLKQSGLAHELVIDDVPKGKKVIHLYRLGIGGVAEITPMELLQSLRQDGVICYFTALEHHDLTTQVAPHHHIASLETVAKRFEDVVYQSAKSGKVPSLGTLLFNHNGVPYYWTKRDQGLLPGVQSIYLSADAIAKVTTLEQTLLDTLHRPWACGGPPVVFEAWERGLGRIDATLLAGYLKVIDRALVNRRVGCMLDLCGYAIKNDHLAELIRDAKAKSAFGPVLSLLPSVSAGKINRDWNLEVSS